MSSESSILEVAQTFVQEEGNKVLIRVEVVVLKTMVKVLFQSESTGYISTNTSNTETLSESAVIL